MENYYRSYDPQLIQFIIITQKSHYTRLVYMFIQLSSHKQSAIRRNKIFINRYKDKQIQKVIAYYYDNNVVRYEAWVKNDMHHCTNGPALLKYYENGQIENETWLKNDTYHRPGNAPADISYYENGQIRFKAWYKDGKIHRTSGPAVMLYFEDGTIQSETWFKNGKYHYRTLII